jgi:hypothetical protein
MISSHCSSSHLPDELSAPGNLTTGRKAAKERTNTSQGKKEVIPILKT